jgi:hypothetical protein
MHGHMRPASAYKIHQQWDFYLQRRLQTGVRRNMVKTGIIPLYNEEADVAFCLCASNATDGLELMEIIWDMYLNWSDRTDRLESVPFDSVK